MLVGTAKNPIPKRFCRKFLRMLSVGWRWTQLCCELGKLLECVQSIVVELPLSDHVAVSIPVMVAQAEWKALKPIIGPVIRFIKRWSCSRILFRYLTCRILIVCRVPVHFRITFVKFGPSSPTACGDGNHAPRCLASGRSRFEDRGPILLALARGRPTRRRS